VTGTVEVNRTWDAKTLWLKGVEPKRGLVLGVTLLGLLPNPVCTIPKPAPISHA
jgi:hypothetical protein